MKNWKIGIRMAAGFGVVIVISAILGIFAYTRVSLINTNTDNIVVNSMPSIYVIGEIAANQQRLNVLLLRHAGTIDAQEKARINTEIETYRSQNSELIAHYEKDLTYDDRDKELFKAIDEARRAFWSGGDEVLKTSSIGTPESSKKAFQMALDLEPANAAYSKAVSADIDYNQQLAIGFDKEIASAIRSAHVGILVCLLLSMIVTTLIAAYITRGITLPLGKAVTTLNQVADGDLTVSLDVNTKDELGQMAAALNRAVEKLNSTLQEVAESAAKASSSSLELAEAAEAIASGAQEQAASLEETSASLEEITAAVRQSADNANQASQLANSSKDSAQQGQEVVANAITAMAEINASSSKISDIISTIDEIAFQTNLLAVNAAVEAARAGEEGRGFAVVASEVRSLAQRSAVAAKEIKVLIQDSLRKVEAGSGLVNRSGETLHGIVGSVKRVTDIVGEIAAASGEQSTGIEQVNTAMTQMDQVTQSNSAQTEELSATAQALSEQAAHLMELVSTFTLSQDGRNARERQAYQPRETNPANFVGASLVHAAKPAMAHSIPRTNSSPQSSQAAQRAGKAARNTAPAKPAPRLRPGKGQNGPQPALLAAASSSGGSDASFEEF
jgi:methyl-accepting chemotaxis protein